MPRTLAEFGGRFFGGAMIAPLVAAAVALVLYGLACWRWWLRVEHVKDESSASELVVRVTVRGWARPGAVAWLALTSVDVRPRIAWLWVWPVALREANEALRVVDPSETRTLAVEAR